MYLLTSSLWLTQQTCLTVILNCLVIKNGGFANSFIMAIVCWTLTVPSILNSLCLKRWYFGIPITQLTLAWGEIRILSLYMQRIQRFLIGSTFKDLFIFGQHHHKLEYVALAFSFRSHPWCYQAARRTSPEASDFEDFSWTTVSSLCAPCKVYYSQGNACLLHISKSHISKWIDDGSCSLQNISRHLFVFTQRTIVFS